MTSLPAKSIFFLLCVFACTVIARDIRAEALYTYVHPDGACGGGNTPCFSCIQEAVEVSPETTVVRVPVGSYLENVSINKIVLADEQWCAYGAADPAGVSRLRYPPNVKSCCNLAMLCGNVGVPSGGVNPPRGQNNVQGACDMGGFRVCGLRAGFGRPSLRFVPC